MEKINKLEWNKGENASWEGVEMNEINFQNRFGCLELIYDNEDEVFGFVKLEDNGEFKRYLIGNSEKEVKIKIIKMFSFTNESHYYDNLLDEHHGFSKTKTNIQINNVQEMIDVIDEFILVNELPEFIKINDLKEFENALDEYYEQNFPTAFNKPPKNND